MMTDKECRLMKIAMDASEVSIAALQMAQANGYLKTREAKSRLLDAIVFQLEKMKKNETNWERYCHIYGFGYKFLRVVHDMNISFKTFALSLDL